jgi:hypothetical protein
MNWKYLVIGLVIIVIPFAVLFARVSSVSKTSKNNDVNLLPTQGNQEIDGPEDLPESVRQAVAQENNSVLLLSRGKVINFNNQNNMLEITSEDKDRESGKTVVKTRTETIDLSLLTQVKCWPEKVPVGNNQEVSILDAYFPLKADSELYLAQEKVETFDVAKDYLKPETFVFVKKKTPTEDPSFFAQQLVIIGC